MMNRKGLLGEVEGDSDRGDDSDFSKWILLSLSEEERKMKKESNRLTTKFSFFCPLSLFFVSSSSLPSSVSILTSCHLYISIFYPLNRLLVSDKARKSLNSSATKRLKRRGEATKLFSLFGLDCRQ